MVSCTLIVILAICLCSIRWYSTKFTLTYPRFGVQNNCICSDHCTDVSCYQGDVDAIVANGYDSVKLDGCGKEYDLDQWYSLINATGHSLLIENCHWGATLLGIPGMCQSN
jgi:hypothetical protein